MLENHPLEICVHAGQSPQICTNVSNHPRAGRDDLTCSLMYISQFQSSLGIAYGDPKVRLLFSSGLRLPFTRTMIEGMTVTSESGLITNLATLHPV